MADTTNIISVKNCLTVQDCARLPIFSNFGWENLYRKHVLDLIKILDIYNDVCRLYALAHISDPCTCTNLIIKIFSSGRIMKHPETLQLTSKFKDIFPDVDPIYLDLVGEVFTFNQNKLLEFIDEMTTTKKSYPKLQEYNVKVQHSKIIKNLTVNFKVDEFLRMCPDPEIHFKRNKLNSKTLHYRESMAYLNNRFKFIHLSTLRKCLRMNNFNLTNTMEVLEANPNENKLKRIRKCMVLCCNTKHENDIEFLKEVAYLEHKEDILNFVKSEKLVRQLQIKDARYNGHLRTCECCLNDELLDSEVRCCPVGHFFCLCCLKKGLETAVGNAKLIFKCFAKCDEEFNLSMFQEIIDDKLYQYIVTHKQAAEVKAACCEGLETCAFCEYSVILSPDITVIKCLNPECKKETCRSCRKENHCPLKCEEVEIPPEIKVRTMIENKMTEVLIKTCYNCQRKFVKEGGCNRMVCSCGKHMCYICRQPVESNYRHFYLAVIRENKCPLYIDENIVHTVAVEAAARLIMNELKVSHPELLKDIDINKILPDIKKRKTNDRHEAKSSPVDVNKIVAKLVGQNVEDINNLVDMRKNNGTPSTKKTKT